MDRFLRFIGELKRRKVFQVASIYLMMAWGMALGASELLPNFDTPPWVVRALVIVLLVLFPVVVALAWYLEWTSSGVQRDAADKAVSWLEGRDTAATMMINANDRWGPVTLTWGTANGHREAQYRESFVVGRDSGCDLSTLDPRASRQHARIELRVDGWWVVDLGSSNGTWLDGVSVKESRLSSRSRIELGSGGQAYQISFGQQEAATLIGR